MHTYSEVSRKPAVQQAAVARQFLSTPLTSCQGKHMNTEMNQSNQANQTSVTAAAHRAVKRKTRITIYLDDEVLQKFRSLSEQSGKGYQTLINAALRTRLAPPALAE
jgi:uncharacterized protein (DUF4415 family)